MRDEYEITPEEQETFMEWWEAHIPKEYVTILNAKSYAEATQAISKIYTVINDCCEDEDEKPEFTLKYDAAFGTHLALNVVITEFGLTMAGDELRNIVASLPQRCRMTIIPRDDFKTLLQFTFYNVKEMLCHEEKEDLC